MSRRTRTLFCAAVVSCGGFAAFAASGFGDDPAPAPEPMGKLQVVRAPVEVAGAPAPASSTARKPPKGSGARKPKPPKITNLITTNPVAVAAGTEVVAQLTCPRNKGIPLSGGAISPPAPASVAIAVISRFNPNPPYDAERDNYYVGVRNFGITDEEFRGTLVCGKGIRESGS